MKVRTHVLARTAVAAGAVASLVTAPSHVPDKIATASAIRPVRADDLGLVRQAQERAARDAFRARLAIERKIEWHRREVAHARAIQAAREAQRARNRAATILVAGDSAAWARSSFAIKVANCESGGGPSDHSPRYDGDPHLRDGAYHGKWQMDSDFWRTYGGIRFASDAADATEAQQDYVAWRGWQHRGWEPWECASLVS